MPNTEQSNKVALNKPIIVIKAGRTAAAAQAAASHTGSLTGSDDVLDAAFRRCGVLRVNTIADLFYQADVLAKQPRPRGPRLTIVTNAGGPGVLATDSLITSGGELAGLSPATLSALNDCLPAHWSHANPIDMLGDADAERYRKTLDVAVHNPDSDGVLVIFTPQSVISPTEAAQPVAAYARTSGKPILASWMGGIEAEAGAAVLNQAGIPTFPYPDTAARVFFDMWRYNYNLRTLYETPVMPLNEPSTPDHEQAMQIVAAARQAGRTLLTEVESKMLLAAYGIPTVETRTARSVEDAVAAADAIGYPVVLKLLSETISHKTDVGGVALNLADAAAASRAYHAIAASVRARAGAAAFSGVTVQPMIAYHGYELIIGSSIDAQFGPVLLFGSGGQLVEVLQDRALALPPLNTTLARRLMEQTRIYRALTGVRGRPPIDIAALEQVVVRFSQLVVEQPAIKEIDINPLLASSEGLLALDARIVLHLATMDEAAFPRPAVRPYPAQYVTHTTLKDGTPVILRPIRAEDEPLMVAFHRTLSEHSVYFRYFHLLSLDQRVTHERLTRICFIDYDREMALVAERTNQDTGAPEIVGVGRLSKLHGTTDAEFAILISDHCQPQGLGTMLLERLVAVGRDEHIRCIVAQILPENRGMQHVCKKLGFRLQPVYAEGVVNVQLCL